MTHTSTEQADLPEALRLADALAERVSLTATGFGFDADLAYAAAELRRLHPRVQELEAIKKAACKAYNAWAYADDIYGEVTQAMNALADAINGITQEEQG